MSNHENHGQAWRYRQIADALVRHGLGYLTGALGLERYVPFHRGMLGHPRRELPYTRPEHIRMALEELGATFTKLGQIISTRADLVSPELAAELARLQDAAPAISLDEIHHVLLAEFGRPAEELFAGFDPRPLAAGSIGQAHTAILADGREVVVKVRRPGVVEEVEADLVILQNLAVRATRRWEAAREYDLLGLVQEFSDTLRAELDYVREARNAERFAANFAGDSRVHIPAIVWETTTTRVLTLERIRGMKVSDVEALRAAGLERKELAARSSQVLLKMVFEDGYFHADPHPGNFFIEPDGRIGVIDFGMVGQVDERTQDHLVSVLVAITSGDEKQLADAFLELGVAREHVERPALERDLRHLVVQYVGRPLGEIALGPLIHEALGIVRHHRLQLPTNLALLLKTLVMSEGMGVQLDPGFRLTAVMAPYAQRLLLRRFAPERLARLASASGLEAARLGVDLPGQARRILTDLERGTLQVGVRPSGLDPLLRHAERLVNRLIVGILAAAFIVGLANLMAVYHPFGGAAWIGPFFAAGFSIAAVLGTILLWRVSRGGIR